MSTRNSSDFKLRQEIKKYFGGSRALECVENYKFLKLLGQGDYGDVYLMEKNNKLLVAKYVEDPKKKYPIQYEVAMQIYFSTLKIAPKIYFFDSWKNNEYSLVVMERIDETLEDVLSQKHSKNFLDYIFKEIGKLIDLLCKYKIRHNDLHWGNIGFLNHKIILIDFGYASIGHKKCLDSIEWFQLARTIYNIEDTSNRDYMGELIFEKLKQVLESEGNTDLARVRSFKSLRKMDNSDKFLFHKRLSKKDRSSYDFSKYIKNYKCFL